MSRVFNSNEARTTDNSCSGSAHSGANRLTSRQSLEARSLALSIGSARDVGPKVGPR